MKSVQFKSKSNEKLTQFKKFRPVKTDNKNQKPLKPEFTNFEGTRPESCPTNNSLWVPSRDWHKYLSGEEPSKPPTKAKDHGYLSQNAESLLQKPPDVKLPAVAFCSLHKEDSLIQVPTSVSISDLCDEDKRKIANLIEELARCKQEKEEDEETILMLKNKVAELKAVLRRSQAEKNSENKSISLMKSLHLDEQAALKKQLSELNELLYQMQVQKGSTEVQMRTISGQAEKMTRAIHALHRENTELQIQLRLTTERLNVAQQGVEKMTRDLREVNDHIKPLKEDKSCQSTEDFDTSERVDLKSMGTSEKIPEDQQILSELFFNKSLQNSFTPTETIIFIPADTDSLFKI